VTPFGHILATPERGTFMGNRGVLHDREGAIKRPWQVKRWLICVLEFRSRKRTVMTPGHYTELFFLDEATALAAGHRPCAECRRPRFLAYCNAWPAGKATAGLIDNQLHSERLGPERSKRLYAANLEELPDGVLVARQGEADKAYLLWKGRLLLWSPAGYREDLPRPQRECVSILTPPSTVEAIRRGYVPETQVR
jgi:hypothetical protein